MTDALSEISDGAIPRSLYGYEVIGHLGEGAGSIIYAVSDPATSQLYALKHVKVKKKKDHRFVDQLVTEFDIGRKVNHPLVRRSVDLKITRTLLLKPTEAALILEMVEGTPCDTHPPTTVEAILHVFQQTIKALHGMHQYGFVHCDLKPNNILVASDGRVKIIDLGQACELGSIKKRIQGTPDFIAPEQVKRQPVTFQTDVYNLGATFYWMLSGKKLPTLFTVKKGKNSFLVADSIPQPHELNPQVPQNLSSLVMECVHVTPSKRPSDMTELCHRLEIIQDGLLKAARPAAPDPEAPPEETDLADSACHI
ncbi:MAG: serine/threonine-protein kinase [Tepidisphaeraceae bacterium]|jgi:serine/threonine-protein kinase